MSTHPSKSTTSPVFATGADVTVPHSTMTIHDPLLGTVTAEQVRDDCWTVHGDGRVLGEVRRSKDGKQWVGEVLPGDGIKFATVRRAVQWIIQFHSDPCRRKE